MHDRGYRVRGPNRMLSALFAVLIAVCAIAGNSANAALYRYDGVVTLCTGTCASFASLDVGTTLSGQWEIDTTPGSVWSLADVGPFAASLTNPGTPLEFFDGTNPTTANPFPLLPTTAPVAVSGGGLTTGGTTDAANELNSGVLLHEFIIPPFNSNGAWAIFDIGAGGTAQMQLCLFFPTAGCIPGATQAVVVDGSFSVVPLPAAVWLLGSVLGLLGWIGRRTGTS